MFDVIVTVVLVSGAAVLCGRWFLSAVKGDKGCGCGGCGGCARKCSGMERDAG